jgi:hypothetical protein
MTATEPKPTESHRLEALIRRAVGWQVDDLHVTECGDAVVLAGHARCAFARGMALEEAARLTGRPVQNRIEVS